MLVGIKKIRLHVAPDVQRRRYWAALGRVKTWNAWRARLGPISKPVFECRPNGIDTHKNQRDDGLGQATRLQLGLKEDDVVFLAFSRIDPRTKGDQLSLVALWRQIVARTPSAVLLVSGRGDRTAQRDFEALARAAGIANRVIVLPNPYDLWPDAKQRIMSAADVFVHVSTGVEETFPLTTLEGMSHGLPLLVTDWAGMRELVTDGVDGFLVPTVSATLDLSVRAAALAFGPSAPDYFFKLARQVGHDGTLLVERAALLATNHARRREMGQRARQTVLDSYRIEKVAQGRVDLLERAARSAIAKPVQTTLLDAQWILDSMAAQPLGRESRLRVAHPQSLEWLPEMANQKIAAGMALAIEAVRAEQRFAAVADALAQPFVSLGLAADASQAYSVIGEVMMRLSNYGVVHVEPPPEATLEVPAGRPQ
jgi:glycosyltransferase involved in cell wall biosynthesis